MKVRYCREKLKEDIKRLEEILCGLEGKQLRRRIVRILIKNNALDPGYNWDHLLLDMAKKAIREHKITKYFVTEIMRKKE